MIGMILIKTKLIEIKYTLPALICQILPFLERAASQNETSAVSVKSSMIGIVDFVKQYQL